MIESLILGLVLLVSLATLLYSIIANYAIRGNDLKHLKQAIREMKEELVKRIERLENRIFENKE